MLLYWCHQTSDRLTEATRAIAWLGSRAETVREMQGYAKRIERWTDLD